MSEKEEVENLNEDDPHTGDDEYDDDDRYDALLAGENLPEPPRPINWYLLTAQEAEAEWLDLNQWVDQLRRTYGLPASVVPPFWYRHPELVWELSALHLHWLCSYDPEQAGTGPLAWHKEFAAARARLREWVTTCGTRLERDRPTRQTTWPGESPQDPIEDQLITDRDADFVEFITADVQARQDSEDEFLRARIDADESPER
ncbi:hypothetical protein [Microbacterium sp. 2MCAF23]|uniref:hypothetical protein n=1 Tax=Microbacterium sp. 2MCAF23 TaxID=3232985 RepID=UPI003F9765D5